MKKFDANKRRQGHFKFGLVLVLLLTVSILVGCQNSRSAIGKPSDENNDALSTGLETFDQVINSRELNDLTLTVYYLDPNMCTRAPYTISDLRDRMAKEPEPGWEHLYTPVITVDSATLMKHIDLLQQIAAEGFTPVENEDWLDARFCYVFATEEHGEILEIVFGFPYNSNYVNKIQVEDTDIFYDIAKTFLEPDVVDELKSYFIPDMVLRREALADKFIYDTSHCLIWKDKDNYYVVISSDAQTSDYCFIFSETGELLYQLEMTRSRITAIHVDDPTSLLQKTADELVSAYGNFHFDAGSSGWYLPAYITDCGSVLEIYFENGIVNSITEHQFIQGETNTYRIGD